jgi:hypothetical protein
MKFVRGSLVLLALFAIAGLGTGCGKKQAAPPPAPAPAPAPVAAVSVATIQLGNAVGADKQVLAPSAEFRPTDTIYAAVNTAGASAGTTLTAKWIYQDGQVVHQESLTIAPTGPAVTDFQISKPDGWPAGDYRVEISIDGNPAGSAAFRVAA